MSANKVTDECKRDATAQVEDQVYPVREVDARLGVSTRSIHTWQKQFSQPVKVIPAVDSQADEISGQSAIWRKSRKIGTFTKLDQLAATSG